MQTSSKLAYLTLASSIKNTQQLSLHTCPCPWVKDILTVVVLRPKLQMIIEAKRFELRWAANTFLFRTFVQSIVFCNFEVCLPIRAPSAEWGERERTDYLCQPAHHSGELIRAAQRIGVVLAILLTPRQHHRLKHHNENSISGRARKAFNRQPVTMLKSRCKVITTVLKNPPQKTKQCWYCFPCMASWIH